VIYTDEERRALIEMLAKSATRASDNRNKIAARAVRELEGAAKDCVARLQEVVTGAVEGRAATVRRVRKIGQQLSTVATALQAPDVQAALSEYGPGVPEEAARTVERVQRACEYYVRNATILPEERNKARSKQIGAILRNFLFYATISWHNTTGKRAKPNVAPDKRPSGPYAKFVMLAIAPLNRGLAGEREDQEFTWPALAQRISRMNLREHHLLQERAPAA
jgi:hypothetical protein